MSKPVISEPDKTEPEKRGRGSGNKWGNSNGMRHGLRGSKLPKGCQYIENRVNLLRRQVEAALVELKGDITITEAAAINSILKWERHGLLAAHWLRKEATSLTPSDRLRFSEAIAKASDNRDKAIRSLRLDRDTTENVIDSLYKRVPSYLSNGDLEDK